MAKFRPWRGGGGLFGTIFGVFCDFESNSGYSGHKRKHLKDYKIRVGMGRGGF